MAMNTHILGLTGLVAMATVACSAEMGAEEKADVGVLQMELSSTVGARVYTLENANFRVQGNGVDLWLNGNDVDVIQQDLAPGDYTITLQDFWRIDRTDGGITEEVPAVLTSPNPVAFTITESEITPVVYSFEAGDGVISFGNGQLQVSVDITENNGNVACVAKSPWNLLSNPGFDGSTGWDLVGGASYEPSEDVESCSGSGSVLIDALTERVEQCLPATANQNYYFGFRFKASGGPSSAGTAICNLFFYDSPGCSGTSIGSGAANASHNSNNWIQGSDTAQSPASTGWMRFNCVGPGTAGYYDQLYLSTTSPGVPAF